MGTGRPQCLQADQQETQASRQVLHNPDHEELEDDGPDSLPVSIIQRCRRIERILCSSHNLRSLGGCPNGLKKLDIGNAPYLSDLSPLASCSMMDYLWIYDSSITEISVVASMPLIETLVCQKGHGSPSIKDLSPLSHSPRLKKLYLNGNRELMDLSPLSSCTALETLYLTNPLVTSLAPVSSLSNLRELSCAGCPLITSLSPLSNLKNLQELFISGIDPQTSQHHALGLRSCSVSLVVWILGSSGTGGRS
jgi:Leucine-rich repeat (LRR) protein